MLFGGGRLVAATLAQCKQARLLSPALSGLLHLWVHLPHQVLIDLHRKNAWSDFSAKEGCSRMRWTELLKKSSDRIQEIKDRYTLGGFKKALLQNPREMIQGRIFSEMIRIQAWKSELRPESRSYRPKVRVTAGQPPRIRTESPRKGTRIGFRCFYRKPPLKPSWIHLRCTPRSREKLHAPPPSPILWPEGMFQWRGAEGCIFWTPRQEFYTASLFYTPPRLEGYFRAGGGVHSPTRSGQNKENLIRKVLRYTSHFEHDTFTKVCPPLDRK